MEFRPISPNFQHNTKGFNRILFLFSSLIDIKIGFVKYIRKYYIFSPFINEDILNMSDKDLMNFHIKDIRDLCRFCFVDKNFIDGAYDLLIEIQEDEKKYKDLLSLSPRTMMIPLIETFISQGNDIKSTIVCSSQLEKKFIVDNLNIKESTVNIIIEKDISNIDTSEYARIVVPYAELVTLFKNPIMRNFLILNYRENFSKDNPKQILPDVIIKVGDVNNCQYCNAYKDIYNN